MLQPHTHRIEVLSTNKDVPKAATQTKKPTRQSKATAAKVSNNLK